MLSFGYTNRAGFSCLTVGRPERFFLCLRKIYVTDTVMEDREREPTMAKTFADFPAAEVALGRARVALGAAFFNAEFSGWQQRIVDAGNLLYMESHDWDAAAIAAHRKLGPRGEMLFTHGDICRAYPGKFNTVAMGCRSDEHVCCDVLDLCWKEAALTVAPASAPMTTAYWSNQFFRRWRRSLRGDADGDIGLLYPPRSVAGCMGST